MKKLFIFSFFIIFIYTNIFAQTDISGDVSGTWLEANSPYNVIGDLTLPAGNSLMVESGVEINFQHHYKFDVYGYLKVDGSPDNRIIFSSPDTVYWAGLRFYNQNINYQDTSMIKYAVFSNGKATGDLYYGGAISLHNSDIKLENIEIYDCKAEGNGGGIYIEDSNPILTDLVIYNNETLYGNGGGIYIYNSIPIMNRILVYSNSAFGSGGGICLFNDSDPILTNLTIYDNTSMQNGSGLACLYNCDVNLINSIIWANNEGQSGQIFVDNYASLQATYSDIEYGSSENYFQDSCIVANPLFIDAENGDFALTENSPCINAGDPDLDGDGEDYNIDEDDQDIDGTRLDMGAVPYIHTGIKGYITVIGDTTGIVEDVIVNINGPTDKTVSPDYSGKYIALNLEPGSYTIKPQLSGYYPDPLELEIDLHEQEIVENQDFTMHLIPPGNIRGHVELNGGSGSEEDVEIYVISNNDTLGPYSPQIQYDENDEIDYYYYNFELTPGIYDILAQLEGYNDTLLENIAVVQGEDNSGNDLILEPITLAGYVSGHVEIVNGTGDVEDVIISDGSNTTNPDVNGNYILESSTGTREITAILESYVTVSKSVSVYYNQTTDNIDFYLVNWEVISGTQYQMDVFATISYNGNYFRKENNKIAAAFGPNGDCRAIGHWENGNYPGWSSSGEHYYDSNGHWYFSIVGNDQIEEGIIFKIFDPLTENIVQARESILFEDGFVGSIDLSVPSTIYNYEISLNQNWNWMSLILKPGDNFIGSIFAPIGTNVNQVKWENESAEYWDNEWIGNLDNIEMNYGLKVSVNSDISFPITGELINSEVNPIPLHWDSTNTYNYNWVSYYPPNTIDSLGNASFSMISLDSAFESIINEIFSVKSQTKSSVYVDGQWYGDLEYMYPNNAYLIDVSAPCYLIYPNEVNKKQISDYTYKDKPKSWNLINGNSGNMILMADFKNLDHQNVDIGLFDKEGQCHSIGKKESQFWYFTILGNEREKLYFGIYNEQDDNTIMSHESVIYESNQVVGSPENPIIYTLEEGITNVVDSKITINNYPNPFNPETTFKYNISEPGIVTLAIYNLKGQLVDVLVNEYQQKDNYSITWDAADCGSGLYFYKLQSKGNTIIKKCMILK